MTDASTMREVLAEFPGAQRALFRRYHIGGCSSCGFQPEETLTQLCARNGSLSVDEVMAHIRESHEADLKMQIAPRELDDARKRDPALKVVDIRTREEHEAARIEGSILFTQELMQEMLGKWPRGAMVVIYDHQGTKSMDAAAYFQGHGFENVRALRGGIDAWSREVDGKVPRYQLE
jgi:rhodanese-related sulfurtransferase